MLKSGSILEDRYRIGEWIGDGGNGTVYDAVQIRTGRRLAVKEISRETFDAGAEKTLAVLKNIRHPGLPLIIDVLNREQSVLLVMEYIPGRTLEEEMDSRFSGGNGFTVDETLRMGIGLCKILSYLHTLSEPILFRDIKPANIMLRPDGGITLVDLGTLTLQSQLEEESSPSLGTMGYAAPELFRKNAEQGVESDLYSVGAVLHHMITGVNPCQRPFAFRKVRCYRTEGAVNGRNAGSLKLRGLERILEKCTSFRSADRYRSATELRKALEHPGACVFLNDSAEWKRIFLAALLLLFSAGAWLLSVHSELVSQKLREEGAAYCRAKALHTEHEEAFEWLDSALYFSPGDAQAISILLDKILSDGVCTAEEQVRVRSVLDRVEEGEERDNEGLLKESPEEYFRIAYRLGTACLYAAEGIPDHGSAVVWFDEALTAGAAWEPEAEGPEQERVLLMKRAEILKRICSYRGQILSGQLGAEADANLTVYWTDLTELLEEDLPAGNLLPVELGLWREILGLLQDWPAELKQEGISWTEQEEITDKIKIWNRALKDGKEAETAPAVRRMLDSLEGTLVLVEKKRMLLMEAEK